MFASKLVKAAVPAVLTADAGAAARTAAPASSPHASPTVQGIPWDLSAVPAAAAGIALAVSAPDDPLERAADRMAGHVLHAPAGLSIGGGVPAPAAPAMQAPAAVHDALRHPGNPLDRATRAFFEPRFQRDLSQVRVHTDASAAVAARELGAAAYTVGRELFFAHGHYAPAAGPGRQLLAHELAHAVQQGSGAALRVARQGIDPRHARGMAGELGMAFIHYRREDGWIVFEGPGGPAGHGVTQRGFDAVAYNTRTGEIHLADNKSLARAGNVGSATAIDPSRNLAQNVDGLIARVEAARDVPGRVRLLARLRAVRAALLGGTPLPSDVKLVVPTVGGRSTGVTPRLANQGVQHLPEPPPKPLAPAPGSQPPAPAPPAPAPPPTPAPVVEPPLATGPAAPKPVAPAPLAPKPVTEPLAPTPVTPAPATPRSGLALRAGLRAGGQALIGVLVFAGLAYLVNRKLSRDLDASIATALAGARGWAERLKREDPSKPVYMRIKVEAKDYSRYVPLMGWLPESPVLHMISIELVRAPTDPPIVDVKDNRLDLLHPGITRTVTYTELMIP